MMTRNFQRKPLFDIAGNAIFTLRNSSVYGGKGRSAPARGLGTSVVTTSLGAPHAKKATTPVWSRHFERTSRPAFECSARANFKALRKGTTELAAPESPVDLTQSATVNLAANELQLARRRQLELQ